MQLSIIYQTKKHLARYYTALWLGATVTLWSQPYRKGRNRATIELELHIEHLDFKKAPEPSRSTYPALAGAAHLLQNRIGKKSEEYRSGPDFQVAGDVSEELKSAYAHSNTHRHEQRVHLRSTNQTTITQIRERERERKCVREELALGWTQRVAIRLRRGRGDEGWGEWRCDVGGGGAAIASTASRTVVGPRSAAAEVRGLGLVGR
jgi:hypothetical protein